MVPRVEALINPSLLTWARESEKFSNESVSSKLNIPLEKLLRWENGDERPSIPQLRKIEAMYRRPIAVFYLPERPHDFAPIRDFRRIPDTIGFMQKSELEFAIRDSYSKRETAIELLQLLGEEIPTPSISINISNSYEDVAKIIRNGINITFDSQLNWRDEYEALDNWRVAVEKQGTLVLQVGGLDISEFRGFSINELPLPVIALNTKDLPRARIFSLLHELVHILLGQSGVCDMREEFRRPLMYKKLKHFAILLPVLYFCLWMKCIEFFQE